MVIYFLGLRYYDSWEWSFCWWDGGDLFAFVVVDVEGEAASVAACFTFCFSEGVELMEPVVPVVEEMKFFHEGS